MDIKIAQNVEKGKLSLCRSGNLKITLFFQRILFKNKRLRLDFRNNVLLAGLNFNQ